MESGRLYVNKPPKASGLATRIGNIDGKLLNNSSMPLKSLLKSAGLEGKTGSFVLPKDHGSIVSSPNVDLQQRVCLASSKSDGPESTNAVASDSLGVTMGSSVKDNGERLADGCNIGGSCGPNVTSDSKSGGVDEATRSGSRVVIPLAVVDDMCTKLTISLYGYFIGQRIAFPIVEDYVKHAWGRFGFEHVILRNGFFFFKFSSLEGMNKVLTGGPWFIRSMPLFLHVWVPNMRLEKEKITKVPVWVRIHDIPSVVYSKAGISLIAKQLGRIIRFDAGTNDMCKNPWGRYSYARVLIELSADLDVLESIEVEIPLPKGKGHYMEVLEVEYEWWPSWCSKCVCFNHDDHVCPLRRKRVTKDSTQQDNEVKGKVHSTKAGHTYDMGKKGVMGASTKPNLIYQPVSKPATKKKNRRVQHKEGAVPKSSNIDSNSSGTSNGDLKCDLGAAAVVEGGRSQFEQPVYVDTDGLREHGSHNDGASTSVAYSEFHSSSSITTPDVVQSPMKRVTFAEEVEVKLLEDEVYENYDDIAYYSKSKNGSPRDFQVQGRKKK